MALSLNRCLGYHLHSRFVATPAGPGRRAATVRRIKNPRNLKADPQLKRKPGSVWEVWVITDCHSFHGSCHKCSPEVSNVAFEEPLD